jgi:hypothetical protein
MGRGLLVAVVGCCACATSGPSAAQGGARFGAEAAPRLSVPVEALFAVCWPPDAASGGQVVLTFLERDVLFTVGEGVSNSTGRCLREIATTAPWPRRPTGELTVRAPTQPIDGWAALAWVELLASTRYGPERGVLAPGPLVAQCLSTAGATRAGARFVVRHGAGTEVRVLPEVLTDADRCVEAVLAATAWPSTRELFFTLEPSRFAPAAAGDVSAYVPAAGGSTGRALDPEGVRDVVRLAAPKVKACWEEALGRRTSIGGTRTFRFQVDDTGAVTAAWVAGGLADGLVAADYLLDRCLAATLRGLRFAPLAGDGVYSWVFASRG